MRCLAVDGAGSRPGRDPQGAGLANIAGRLRTMHCEARKGGAVAATVRIPRDEP